MNNKSASYCLESRLKSPVASGDFLATSFADQKRVSGESRRKFEGGILTGPQGSLYIYFINIYIPYIYINNKYTIRTASGAAEKSSEAFPATFPTFNEEQHQMRLKSCLDFMTGFHFGGLS